MLKFVRVSLLFALLSGPVLAEGLSPAQMVKPGDLTQEEGDFYRAVKDPEIGKNFLITRSYVRLCKKVIDKTLPPEQLPAKPLGYANSYLLPGEKETVDVAIRQSITAAFKSTAPAKR